MKPILVDFSSLGMLLMPKVHILTGKRDYGDVVIEFIKTATVILSTTRECLRRQNLQLGRITIIKNLGLDMHDPIIANVITECLIETVQWLSEVLDVGYVHPSAAESTMRSRVSDTIDLLSVRNCGLGKHECCKDSLVRYAPIKYMERCGAYMVRFDKPAWVA